MEYKVEVEGSFTTTITVDAVNDKVAKIIAAERIMDSFPTPDSYNIDLVSCFGDTY